jgi:hypothetical protein
MSRLETSPLVLITLSLRRLFRCLDIQCLFDRMEGRP